MRFLVFGAGAIGTYIGGSLALANHSVVFLERQDVAVGLSRQGLCLRLADGEHRITAPRVAVAVREAVDWGPYDAAILAVKSFDTPAILEMLVPFREKLPPLLCLQNGVENEPLIAQALGDAQVIAGSVTTAIGRIGAGDIRLERLRGVGIAAGRPVSAALVDAFNSAGLNARMYANPAGMKWSKMLTNLVVNASSAILDMPPTEILSDPRLFRLEMEQLREALRVMRAYRIPVVDLPGTPVRLMAFAARDLPAALSQPLMRRALGRGRGDKMPSFHIDLHSGRKTSEVDYLNGAVIRFGERRGIPTPVNRMLRDTLLSLVSGETPVTAYSRDVAAYLARVGIDTQKSPND